MSLFSSPPTWLRLTFRWSTSVQAWHERVGDLFLAIGGVTAAALGLLAWQGTLDWPLWLVVLAMAGLAAPALVLHRAGWLKVFGPVLYYYMIRQARRSRFIVLRILYALLNGTTTAVPTRSTNRSKTRSPHV